MPQEPYPAPAESIPYPPDAVSLPPPSGGIAPLPPCATCGEDVCAHERVYEVL